jgi:short-subunit dehydrogenase
LNHGDVLGLSRSIGKEYETSGRHKYKHIRCDLSDPSIFSSPSELQLKIAEFVQNEEFSLVLNAATFYSGDKRLSAFKLENIFHVNVISSMKLVDVLRDLSLRRVLFVNSVSGLIGQEYQHEYAATKHSLMGFSKSLAKTAKHSSFDVMTINPGGMKTELWLNYPSTNCSDFLSPSVVADICEHLLLIPGRVFIENFVLLPPSDV